MVKRTALLVAAVLGIFLSCRWAYSATCVSTPQGTNTSNLDLCQIASGATGWLSDIHNNNLILDNLFSATTGGGGHNHSGSAGMGPKIPPNSLLGVTEVSTDGFCPKYDTATTKFRWENCDTVGGSCVSGAKLLDADSNCLTYSADADADTIAQRTSDGSLAATEIIFTPQIAPAPTTDGHCAFDTDPDPPQLKCGTGGSTVTLKEDTNASTECATTQLLFGGVGGCVTASTGTTGSTVCRRDIGGASAFTGVTVDYVDFNGSAAPNPTATGKCEWDTGSNCLQCGNGSTTENLCAGGGVTDHGALTGLADDDHQQYALLAGRAGGQNLIGATGSGQNLSLTSTSDATLGFVQSTDEFQSMTTLTTVDADRNAFSTPTANTYTVSGTTAFHFLHQASTIESADMSAVQLVMGYNGSTYRATTTPTGGAGPQFFMFVNSATLEAANGVAVTDTSGRMVAFADLMSFSTAGTGTISGADTDYISFISGPAMATANTDLDTLSAFVAGDANSQTAGATCALRIGFDVADLPTCTAAIGIRNDSTTVYPPDTSQAITVAGDTIDVSDGTFVMISNTTGGSITLTSTPTIADGVGDGQKVTIMNVGADNVVLQDQGTLGSSNLRLSATGQTLGQRDNITLIYSSSIGDWVEVSFTNVL